MIDVVICNVWIYTSSFFGTLLYLLFEHGVSFLFFDFLSKDENVNVVVVDTNFTEVFVYFISFVFNYLTYIYYY